MYKPMHISLFCLPVSDTVTGLSVILSRSQHAAWQPLQDVSAEIMATIDYRNGKFQFVLTLIVMILASGLGGGGGVGVGG